METLRPYVPEPQDENSGPGVSLLRGEVKGFGTYAKTPGMDGKAGLGGKVFGGSGTGSAPRRALGNITNMTPAKTFNAAPSAKATPRRALGDITNSNVSGAGGPSAVKGLAVAPANKAAQASQQAPMQQAKPKPPTITHGLKIPERLKWAEPEIDRLADIYAQEDEELERFAGPIWEEQEEERRQREAAEEAEGPVHGGLSAANFAALAFGPAPTPAKLAQHAADVAAANAFDNPRKRDRSQDNVEVIDLPDFPEFEEIPLTPDTDSSFQDLTWGDLQKEDLNALLDALAIADPADMQILSDENSSIDLGDEASNEATEGDAE